MAAGKIKVYELAKELSQEPQSVIEVARRLGLDIKNAMSFLGSEEAKNVRSYYRQHKPVARSVAPPKKGPMTERRVGSRIIRRRKAPAPVEAPASSEPPIQAPARTVAEPKAQPKVAAKAPPPPPPPESEPSMESAPVDGAEKSKRRHLEPIIKRSAAPKPAPPRPKKPKKLEVKEEPPAPAEAPAAEPKVDEKRGRRHISPIIKKVATEEYLGEKIGPKPEKRERPKTAAKAGGATQTTATSSGVGARKVVKEIEFPTQTEGQARGGAAGATDNKRRALNRQSAVFRSTDYLKRELIRSKTKKKPVLNRPAMKTKITTPAEHKRVVEMGELISVGDLAHEMGVKVPKLMQKLVQLGVSASINQSIDYDTAVLVTSDFGFNIRQKVFKETDFLPQAEAKEENLRTRGPVVTVMGHVDHGKTSLLDKIRKAKVAEGEAGGITQHIGAYTVKMKQGSITFIDTPGHEAFTAMRARGAKVTDIVILVVSAVDGVMPQTVESVNHAKAAGVPIIVAVNKSDLPDGNPDKIKQGLANYELTPEEWGGDTIFVNVSAKTGDGIDALLESIQLQAELLELKADPSIPAIGTIIESRLDKGRGVIAVVLIQSGHLNRGDVVAVGSVFGKVRVITDFKGKQTKIANPSDAVEILGLPEVPEVGDELRAVENEKAARDLTTARLNQKRAEKMESSRPTFNLEEMLSPSADLKELRLVLKADVAGSVEAVKQALLQFPQEKVKLKILHAGTGGVTGSDVNLAGASGGVVIGFNVRPDTQAKRQAEQDGVEIRTYRVIYDLIEEVKKLLEGLIQSKFKETVIGRAQVRDTFVVPKVGTIAGSAVVDGKFTRGCFLRLLRNSQIVYEGKLSSLRRFKDDVKEVVSGYECGIGLENFNDVKQGDELEAFVKEEVRESL